MTKMRWGFGMVFGLCTSIAMAQQSKPGLWEVTTRMNDPKMQAQMDAAMKQLEKMPPKERKMMEEMMAKQGVTMPSGGAIGSRFCVTKDMAEKDYVPAPAEGCTQQSQRKGNQLTINMQCTKPKSDIVMVANFISDTQYTMTMKGSGPTPDSNVDMTGSGKWLGADCGTLKPMLVPPTGK
jgi:hypothetical protein